MSATMLLWPMVLQAFITLILYFLMFRVRVGMMKSGEAKASQFRTYEDEPVESRKWSRAIANQYETPVLFYALCLASLQFGSVDMVTVILAWAYSIIKATHVYVHVTDNNLRIRQPVFSLAYLFLVLGWVWFALRLLGVGA